MLITLMSHSRYSSVLSTCCQLCIRSVLYCFLARILVSQINRIHSFVLFGMEEIAAAVVVDPIVVIIVACVSVCDTIHLVEYHRYYCYHC